jgi:hypothetical protein
MTSHQKAGFGFLATASILLIGGTAHAAFAARHPLAATIYEPYVTPIVQPSFGYPDVVVFCLVEHMLVLLGLRFLLKNDPSDYVIIEI